MYLQHFCIRNIAYDLSTANTEKYSVNKRYYKLKPVTQKNFINFYYK